MGHTITLLLLHTQSHSCYCTHTITLLLLHTQSHSCYCTHNLTLVTVPAPAPARLESDLAAARSKAASLEVALKAKESEGVRQAKLLEQTKASEQDFASRQLEAEVGGGGACGWGPSKQLPYELGRGGHAVDQLPECLPDENTVHTACTSHHIHTTACHIHATYQHVVSHLHAHAHSQEQPCTFNQPRGPC